HGNPEDSGPGGPELVYGAPQRHGYSEVEQRRTDRGELPRLWLASVTGPAADARPGLLDNETQHMVLLWRVGDRIQDRWEVHRIQRGTKGIVYLVYDHATRLPYAAKTLTEEFVTAHPALAERFVQAARAWMGLAGHYNIAQAHSVEIIDGQPLVFLEHVSGGSLRDWLGLPRLTQD